MKTIKEAKKGLPENKGFLMSSINQIAETSFEAGAEFAQRWISVSECKPPVMKTKECDYKFSENILIKDKKNRVVLGFYSYMTGVFNVLDGNLSFIEATHWRPIEIK